MWREAKKKADISMIDFVALKTSKPDCDMSKLFSIFLANICFAGFGPACP